MEEARLVATDVVLGSGRRLFLNQVSVLVGAGQMVAVTGPSGSGKTSLLSVLGGLVRPRSGTVSYGGGPVGSLDGEPRRGTAFILQTYGLVPTLTVEENVAIGLRARSVNGPDATARALLALDRVGIAELADRLVDELSGGQLQRVAVARALVVEPDVLLADEPTSELDEGTRDHVVRELRAEADRGALVVVATHDPEVADLCDLEVKLDEGKVERTVEPVAVEPGHEHDLFKPPPRST